MSLRETKRIATARRIRGAARGLFLRQGFAETTMDQVAAEAGVSRASLFNYYPGKAALLDSLAEELESRLLQAVQHYRDKHPPPTALAALFDHAAQVLEQTAALTRLLLVKATGGAGFPALLTSFEDLVRSGQADRNWRDDVDALRLAEIIYLEFIAGLLDWCRAPGQAHRALFEGRVAALNRLLASPGA